MQTNQVVPVIGSGGGQGQDAAVRECLRETPPRLPAWFGYDPVGSTAFEQITALPTYYLSRVERDLLDHHAPEVAALLGNTWIAELGSGNAKKTRLLLESCARLRETTYLPIDIDRAVLDSSSAELCSALPQLRVVPLWGRYEDGLAWLRTRGDSPLVVAFLGSNLGNATLQERRALLGEITRTLRPGDDFLVSADLDKPGDVLERCYNDPGGHRAFAQFRLNYLTQLNARCGADFALDDFVPEATYDPDTSTVEGHLRAQVDRTVEIPGLDLTLHLRRGDSINVGYSAKFDSHRLTDEIAGHGFELRQRWIDTSAQYAIFLFRRTAAAPRGEAPAHR